MPDNGISNGGGIGTGGAETTCRTSPRRYLVVPAPEMASCSVLRAAATADSSTQEAGLAVRQPTLDPTVANVPLGDIRPTVGGTPEEALAGYLTVNKPGVVEDARFGWARDGETGDLQLRQSPHVVGRRPDMLVRRASGKRRAVRPKMLSLKSGNLFACYVDSDWSPIWGDNASLITVTAQTIKVTTLDSSNDTWSTPAAGPVPSNSSSSAVYIDGVDVVQYPDTGELIMFIAACNNHSVPSTPRYMFVFVSTDDGVTWVERKRLNFDGEIPDILLDANGDGAKDDTSPICSLAAELLPSGRVVVVMATLYNTWSLTTDDRGASWGVNLVLDHAADQSWKMGHGVSSTLTRNGIALFTVARHDRVDGSPSVYLYITADGVTFTSIDVTENNMETLDVSICLSPDGWPHIYGTAHTFFNPSGGGATESDWLWGRRLLERDFDLSMDQSDVMPVTEAGSIGRSTLAFHTIAMGLSSGRYTSILGLLQVQYAGFNCIETIHHRGQVVMMVTVLKEDTADAGTQPDMLLSALMVYRLNHWQPLQEKLGQAHPSLNSWSPAYPAGGFIYNRTWDCYDEPSGWAYTKVAGGGTVAFVEGGAEGGYMSLDSAGGSVYYTEGALPDPALSRDAMVRVVWQAEAGGSATADDIALRINAAYGGSGAGITIRLERTAFDQIVHVIATVSGASQGTASFPLDSWIEVLVCTTHSGGLFNAVVYARDYPRATDPDWNQPYTKVAGVAAGAVTASADYLTFGNISGAVDAKSWWKCVHLSRVAEQGATGLERRATNYTDTDQGNDRSVDGTGETAVDSGIYNWMRTAQMISHPPQFFERGLSVSWRGEATTKGQYPYETGYDYEAESLMILPALREWRAQDNSKEIEIVLDADPDNEGKVWRPDAIAMFGRNFPEVTIQMNDSDSWGAPTIEYALGAPGMLGNTPNRYTHLWSCNLVTFDYWIQDRRLTVTQTSGAYPWRAHQFKSMVTGQKFYVCVRRASNNTTYIYRIEDNTEDTLIFATEPTTADFKVGNTFTSEFSIFSDRLASLLEWVYPEGYPTGGTPPSISHHVKGYRYLRLLIPAYTFRDADEAFTRCGYVMLGKAADLSPDAEWGWSRTEESGYEVSYERGGAGRASRNSPPRRVFSLSFGYLSPPVEMSNYYGSPGNAAPDGKNTWAHWLDVVRALEADGVPAALIWEADRAWGLRYDLEVEPVATDPKDVMLCRVTSPGSVDHVQWELQTLNLAGGDTTVPRPAASISGITFTEEF